MGMTNYRDLLRVPAVRNMFVLTLFSRTPLWATNVVLALHVVGPLDRSYAMAGLVTAVQAICLGISGPYRGRRLDRMGLRRSIIPSLIVVPVCWAFAPWLGYWPLLLLAAVAGLFAVPTFAITRSVLIGNSAAHQRSSAMALDGILSDITFMAGPTIGVALTSVMSTAAVLFVSQMAMAAACLAIWIVNPPMQAAGSAVPEPDLTAVTPSWWRHIIPGWFTVPVVVLLAIGLAGNFTLSGQSLGIVAAMRSWNAPEAIGWMLALWGFGSMVGGFIYGLLPRPPRSAILLAALGISALIVLPAPGPAWFAILVTLTGAFSAPVVVGVANELSHLVPAAHRGEAMSWHGSVTIMGNALGGPVVGVGLDAHGWQGGMLVAAAGGLLVAGIGLLPALKPALPNRDSGLPIRSRRRGGRRLWFYRYKRRQS